MKRSILVAALTAFLSSLSLSTANAQIWRVPCAGGNCPQRAQVAQYSRVYAPYSYAQAVAPCEAAQPVAPCNPVVEAETVETPAPCDAVEAVEPCGPVVASDDAEYIPTESGNICVNGTCPIRNLTGAAVNVAAKTAKGAVEKVAASARWLLAVNKTRARYGLPALTGAADLDAGCNVVANNCARTGTLTHGAGYEIIAYNYSGIDAALVQWLNSPAHRALLLSPNFRAAGVSVVRSRDGRVYCAVKFR